MCTNKNFYFERCRCYCNSPLEIREWLKRIQNFEREKQSDNNDKENLAVKIKVHQEIGVI
jgi:hypothetical protein